MKEKLLNDSSICKENRKLFREFFDWEENKLKRINGLTALDESTYKTLCTYVTKFRNVNNWFANKPWVNLDKKDIKKVYDDLEDWANYDYYEVQTPWLKSEVTQQIRDFNLNHCPYVL